jgi:hypothetical protein
MATRFSLVDRWRAAYARGTSTSEHRRSTRARLVVLGGALAALVVAAVTGTCGKVVRPDPRPRELLFRLTAADGTVTEVTATLEDTDGFQKVKLETDDVASVESVVVNCFPDPVVTVCPITELEFQKKK